MSSTKNENGDYKTKENIVRPWDRKRLVLQQKHQRAQERQAQQQAEEGHVPFVQVQGKRYYSDRFYLNRTVYDNDQNHNGSDNPNDGRKEPACTCGAETPPPLLDRAQLVASLSLKAALLATYTLQGRCLRQEFPQLFGVDATVPTLVLHGRAPKETKQQQQQTTESDHDSRCGDEEEENEVHEGLPQVNSDDNDSDKSDDDDEDEDDLLSVGTQNAEMRGYASSYHDSNAKGETTKQNAPIPPDTTPNDDKETRDKHSKFPSHVHFTSVTSSWISPIDLPDQILGPDGQSISKHILEKRKFKRGVHHPKFMILWETNGSVVVLVSTANWVSPSSTDGTWVQRFPAATTATMTPGPTACPGRVLGHFLDCQTWAAQADKMTPLGFGRRYLGWTSRSCQEWCRDFDLSQSQVFLVPHVPGDYDIATLDQTDDGDKKKKKSQEEPSMFRYGRHFVSHVLKQLEGRASATRMAATTSSLHCHNLKRQPWLPSSILSDQDRIVLQPTSFGGEWRPNKLRSVVQSYLGTDTHSQRNGHEKATAADNEDDNSESSNHQEDFLNRLDIVWPTDDFIKAIRSEKKRKRSIVTRSISPNSVVQTGFQQTCQSSGTGQKRQRKEDAPETERVQRGLLFLSSKTFNTIHIDCLSRMVMFEPSTPLQQPNILIPHFKSVARLFGGKRYRIQKDYGLGKSEELFSWFLMTSACLSRGAQGEERVVAHRKVASYSNFELGVLFCSRLQGKAHSDRLYCWKPAFCSCASSHSPCEDTATQGSTQPEQQPQQARLVHLPIPYHLRPNPYHEDEQDVEFCETPFLSEIPRGTGNIGHMKLTPLGLSLSRIKSQKC